ncbi:MAG: plasminogen-binding N-terminal domain-containing protein, partial [Sulfurimonas sp.]|nr:plasminogen-binding N-terminal domain-containing protein [Sulfurimonas sp.]
MIKHIFLFFIFTLTLIAGVIKTPILSVDKSSNTATIKVSSVDVGVSGFVVHQLSEDSSIILKDVVVTNYDKSSKIAT